MRHWIGACLGRFHRHEPLGGVRLSFKRQVGSGSLLFRLQVTVCHMFLPVIAEWPSLKVSFNPTSSIYKISKIKIIRMKEQ
jgi:hypothetical protein